MNCLYEVIALNYRYSQRMVRQLGECFFRVFCTAETQSLFSQRLFVTRPAKRLGNHSCQDRWAWRWFFSVVSPGQQISGAQSHAEFLSCYPADYRISSYVSNPLWMIFSCCYSSSFIIQWFSIVMLEFLAKLLKHQLMERIYDALVAQLELTVHHYDRGLVIKVAGFNHKLHVISVASVHIFSDGHNICVACSSPFSFCSMR